MTITMPSAVPSLLLVAFIVLKLTSVIDWSWWWVLAPLWIPAAIVLLFAAGAIAFYAAVGQVDSRRHQR